MLMSPFEAEDPIYVLENSVPIDTMYYLENQLAKPLSRIFEPILGDKAESLLTKGDHTRVTTKSVSKVGGLTAFTKKSFTCLGCKAVLKGKEATCQHCFPKASEIYQREIYGLTALETKYGRLWTECQRCSGSLLEEVLCTARDCPIFYMREKVRFDVKEQTELIERFGKAAW
uniref:DNA-directed DNA polymerase n=1 Tax=Plectus sambesii TaxID=2011161 RepID=A0A914W857_9BILA